MRPKGYAWLIPYLNVRDPLKSMAFYGSVFGLEKGAINEQDGKITHAEMTYQGETVLMMKPEGIHDPSAKAPVTMNVSSHSDFALYVANADEVFSRALAHGGKEIAKPGDMPWGERHAVIKDIDGYTWVIASIIEAKS